MIQKVPALESGKRPETGVMQFGDDWPGVFIRGDNAMMFSADLRMFVESGGQYPNIVSDLTELLASCDMKKHLEKLQKERYATNKD